MRPTIVLGDLLDQDVDVIVNAWNRNILPWWLLLPQGLSAAIKRRAGLQPFRELARHGPIPLGSITDSVRSAMGLVAAHGFSSVAFPLIGAGTGGKRPEQVLELMMRVFEELDSAAHVVVVRYSAAP